ncbi:MAG: hypothetical protein ACOY37_10565 [Pseudomonadota bacterium]
MSRLLFSRPHFGLIRQRVAVALAIVGAAALLYGLAHWQATRAESAQQQAGTQLAALQAELEQMRSGDAGVDADLRHYRALVGGGFVGEGDRVAWTEALLDAQQALALPPLRFELAARRALADGTAAPTDPGTDPSLVAAVPSPGAQAHDLRFEVSGIHEGELLALLDHLRARRLGDFRVQDCELKRAQAIGLDVACTLRWITYLPASAVAQAEATP